MSQVEQIYVILPTYNNEKTIIRAIESVLNQDYDGNLFLAVVPNGCTDRTFELVQEAQFAYNRSEKRSYKRKFEIEVSEQKGVVASFNKGLDFAAYMHVWPDELLLNPSTTWVCRMDGDDAWYPNKIRKQVEFLEKNPDVDVVGAQMKYVTPETYEVLGTTNNPLEHHEIHMMMLQGSNVVANPVAMYRWDVMTKAGRLEDIFPYAEDYWFWLKVLLTGYKFENMPDVLMDYTYEPKPHENPQIGQNVAQVAKFILGYNQNFRKK